MTFYAFSNHFCGHAIDSGLKVSTFVRRDIAAPNERDICILIKYNLIFFYNWSFTFCSLFCSDSGHYFDL